MHVSQKKFAVQEVEFYLYICMYAQTYMCTYTHAHMHVSQEKGAVQEDEFYLCIERLFSDRQELVALMQVEYVCVCESECIYTHTYIHTSIYVYVCMYAPT
jgi:hypothetical protein